MRHQHRMTAATTTETPTQLADHLAAFNAGIERARAAYAEETDDDPGPCLVCGTTWPECLDTLGGVGCCHDHDHPQEHR